MYWRNAWWHGKVFPSCEQIELPEGMLVSHDLQSSVQYIGKALYTQLCYQGRTPMLNTNAGVVIDQFSRPLPLIQSSWKEFTRDNLRGSFAYSVVSIIYALSVSAVIIWFLTIFVLTNYTIKPSVLLQVSTSLSSVYIVVVVIKSIVVLHGQQRDGFLHGAMLLDQINGSTAVNALDLIVVLLLQVNQVQVIMRIFSRQKDKRLTFFVGVIASITSQAIWGVSKFHKFSREDEAGDILPAFIYLVRIAMGICYAAIISVFVMTKIHYIIANKKIWLLSILTFILIYSPVAFFIADVANAFVYELSEIFSVVTYVICVVIPWEWCNKFNLIMKAKEKEGVLGRRFYEDELYELDRVELFVEENEEGPPGDDPESNGNGGTEQESRNINGVTIEEEELTNAKKVLSALKKTKKTFLTLTDGIIAAGFAIPRSVSISTPPIDSRRNNDMEEVTPHISSSRFLHENTAGPSHVISSTTTGNETNEIAHSESNMTIPTASRNRRNVYVYSRKEVVINFSDDDDD
ncbi:PalH/RIM21-domain-containing protein [Scheffersomyces xylosifermentans]|uniref:PalH/RIM21-domain-containing protein n=1 Tax=Scheffersomyces xylosifermentans TaxID=1304137 RepID=UPI00315E0069